VSKTKNHSESYNSIDPKLIKNLQIAQDKVTRESHKVDMTTKCDLNVRDDLRENWTDSIEEDELISLNSGVGD